MAEVDRDSRIQFHFISVPSVFVHGFDAREFKTCACICSLCTHILQSPHTHCSGDGYSHPNDSFCTDVK